MNDDDRKALTLYLGECWHEPDSECALGREYNGGGMMKQKCLKCGCLLSTTYQIYEDNRTFDTRADMMDLYEAIVKRGEFSSIFNYLHGKCDWKELDPIRDNVFEYLFKWIICLSGESYEDRCQMVVDWVKEASHES